MRPRISLLLLFLFLPLIAIAETPLAPFVVGRAPGYQRQAHIAANNGQYFVAWDDDREVVSDQPYGARLAADGTLLDPVDIRLEGLASARGVGCGGGLCVVVDHQLHFVMIDSDGKVVTHGTIAGEITQHVDVLYNGRDFIVFWGYNDVNASTLTVDGQVLGERVVIAPYAGSPRRFQSAAFNGSRFVVLYTDTDRALLKAAVVEATGRLLTTDVVVAEGVFDNGPGPPAASIAASGGELVAVWRFQNELRALRFGMDGARIGDPVLVRKDTSFIFDIVSAAEGYVAYATEGWPNMKLVAVPISRELAVSEARVVLTPQPFAIGTFAAAEDLVVADLAHPNEARGCEIVAVGTAPSPIVVSRAAGSQRNPEIAIGPDTMLVVVEEDRGGGPDQPLTSVRATFTDRGTGVTSTFAIAPSEISQSRPVVAVAGDTYVVIWAEGSGLRARIVRGGEPSGSVIELDSASQLAAVASNGRDFFVASYEFPASTLVTTRMSANGDLLGRSEAIPVSAPLGTPAIAIACANDECVLAWRSLIVGPCVHLICKTDDRVLAARMVTSLVLRDAMPFVLTATSYGIGNVVAAAAGDGAYAVAWDYPGIVKARAVDAFGGVGETVERAGYRPALARQAGSWLLLRDTAYVAGPRISATRFRSGLVATDFEFTIADAQARMNAVAATDGERVVVAYERTTRNEEAGGVPRVYLDGIDPPRPRVRAVRQ